tara:strand:+ start:3052 stop:3927 length:876 start_codon:yes stop_codon:yes gene_type:complete
MLQELEKQAGQFNKSDSSDHLQLLAKRAAGQFIGKDSDSLTSAVGDVIKGEGLNKDQIRRVSEMANQSAWKSMFVESGNRNTSFDPANADEIIGSLDKSPAEYSEPNLDYYKDHDSHSSDSIDLESVFNTDSKADPIPHLNPTSSEEVAHEKAASVQGLTRYSLDALTLALNEVSEDFYGHVKVAHTTDGFGILQIAKAVSEAVGSEKFASSVMSAAANRLKDEGVVIKVATELSKSKEPVVVNTEHPLLLSAVKLEKLGMAYNKAKKLNKKAKADANDKRKALLDKLRGA